MTNSMHNTREWQNEANDGLWANYIFYKQYIFIFFSEIEKPIFGSKTKEPELDRTRTGSNRNRSEPEPTETEPNRTEPWDSWVKRCSKCLSKQESYKPTPRHIPAWGLVSRIWPCIGRTVFFKFCCMSCMFFMLFICWYCCFFSF